MPWISTYTKITNCVVMHDSPSAFLDITNVHLSPFISGYDTPLYDW